MDENTTSKDLSRFFQHGAWLCLTLVAFFTSIVAASPAFAQDGTRKSELDSRGLERARKLVKRLDSNGDGQIDRSEWGDRQRSRFHQLDLDGDGLLTMKELSAPRGQRRRGGGDEDRTRAAAESVRLEGQVDRQILDRETLCAMARGRRCDVSLAVSRGLFETGLKPVFPDGLQCRDIDVAYSVDLSRSRSREAYHGGIDIPAPFRTPIIAAAAGTVVAKFSGEESNRGISVILRHSPKETGLPIWTYTEYAHLDKMPHLTLGQVVRMGEVLGVTGNSGTQPRRARPERRPAIHFAVWYSKDPRFAVLRRVVAPVGGYWMDPNALYRIGPPFDSHSLKELRDNEKKVPVAVMTESGDVIPSNAKIVWPYRCKRS